MQFGGDYLFQDATFTIRPGDRMGLVGPNGAGKTTLLRIIAGMYTPETGSVNFPTDFHLGYLPQEPKLDADSQFRTVRAEALRAREDLTAIDVELQQIQQQLELATEHESEGYLKLLERFGSLHHRFADGGGFELESRTEKVLMGLGFTIQDLDQEVRTFSGGWQMRLYLAKLILSNPDALLLDEPTNHLDLESLMWLEDYLRSFAGTILLVSHDRTFLNAITNRIAEIEKGAGITVYTGNYDAYERTKAEREIQLAAKAANLDAKRKELERFVERFRYKATKARQAQSRLKMLQRMERIELSSKGAPVHFAFPAAQASGRMVFEIEQGAKAFVEGQNVFRGVDLRIERGDRVAFLGKNGQGKTTLAKILAGQEQLTAGTFTGGHNVTIGYYAQHQADALDPSKTVLATLEEVSRAQFFHQTANASTPKNQSQLRTLLGAFLFHGDDVFKPVKVLSGGEKSRLALAKMLLEPTNTLILDEPTNHLDMASKEVVKEALLQFAGTIIVVSHDRDFLDDLCDRLITFEDGHVKETLLPLEEYLAGLRERELQQLQQKRAAARIEQATPPPNSAQLNEREKPSSTQSKKSQQARKREEAEKRAARSEMERPIRAKLQRIETKIESLETAKTSLLDEMYDPTFYEDTDRVKEVNSKIAEVTGQLESCYHDWAKVAEELEAMKESS